MDKEFFKNSPIALIHYRIQYQVDTLFDFGEEIVQLIDKSLKDIPKVYPDEASIAIRNIWFWVLAAYEVTRSLDEKKQLFTDAVASKITSLKRLLNKLRIPFAKHQLAGQKNSFIKHEIDMVGINKDVTDFIFIVEDKEFTFKEIFSEFKKVYKQITFEDINKKPLIEFLEKYKTS